MKRGKKAFFISLALLAAEIGLFALLALRGRAGSAAPAPELLLSETASEIEGISVTRSDGTSYGFIIKEGTWQWDPALPGAENGVISGEEQADESESGGEVLSQEAVRAFVSGVTGIAVRGTIPDAEDLSQYGLDRPFAEVRVLAGGTEHTLLISETAENANAVYVILDGDEERILICVPALKTNFEKDPADFLFS